MEVTETQLEELQRLPEIEALLEDEVEGGELCLVTCGVTCTESWSGS